jgi:hypothetical protein
MLNTSLASKVAELENASADMEAEGALAKLEQQLGFTSATVSVGADTSAEAALTQLEQRLNG